jgi:uncharacterized protein (DUF58 family)
MAQAEYGPLLESLRGVRWPSRRRSSTVLPGAHASRRTGRSTELTEHRLYRQGDDPRRLDWRLLARTDRPYVRLANDRTTVPLFVVVDASSSMNFPERGRTKWRLACELAVGLCAVAHAEGDPAGLGIAHDGRPLWLGPRGRRDAIADVARILARARVGGTPEIAPVLAAAPANARVALISDMLSDEDALLATAARRTAAGGEVHFIHVMASEEMNPGGDPRLAFDPEAPDTRRALSSATLDAYQANFAAWREELQRRCHERDVRYVNAATDEEPPRIVRRIVAPVLSETMR